MLKQTHANKVSNANFVVRVGPHLTVDESGTKLSYTLVGMGCRIANEWKVVGSMVLLASRAEQYTINNYAVNVGRTYGCSETISTCAEPPPTNICGAVPAPRQSLLEAATCSGVSATRIRNAYGKG